MPRTTRQARFKAVAFADGEEVTYLRGERDRLTVSGLKGDKHLLSQGDARLRRHALAPRRDGVSGRREREASTVSSNALSRGFEQIADDACGDNLFSSPQPARAPAQPKTDDKPAAPN